MPKNYFGEHIAKNYDESAAQMFEPAKVDPVVDFIADLAFDKAALDREKSKMIVLILQHFHLSFFQRTDQRRMSVQNFEHPIHTGQLHTVYIGAEQLFFGCQYF